MPYLSIFGSVRLDLLLIACLMLIALFVRAWWSRIWKFPPGPVGLPIIGYVPILTSHRQVKLMELGRKYGDIFSVRFGTSLYVVLSSEDAVREVLGKPELADRPGHDLLLLAPKKDPYFANGAAFHENKKFALRVFRLLSAEKVMEEQMKVQIKNYIDILSDQKGKTFESREILFCTAVDIVLQWSFGENFKLKDHERKMLHKFVSETMKMIDRSTILFLFPWMKHFDFVRKILHLDEFDELYKEGDAFLRNKMQEVKAYYDGTVEDCLAGHYFKEMILNGQIGKSSTFSEEQLRDGIKLLLGAGSETVRDTLTWALYTVAVYEDAQRKVHREIDRVVGRDTMPSFSDQKDMRYTQAVLMEVLRWQPTVPLGIRVVSADTNFRQYQVPKGTPVLVNHWAVHRDPRYWRLPDDFIPERFLTPDGKHILKHDSYMPFSYGKRNCLGESIAVMEVFLFFTCILQKFEVKLPVGEKPNFEGFLALTHQMKNGKLRYIPRNP